MAKLRAKTRNALPSSDFGLPGGRKYPMEDRAHAIDAKGRAEQQYAKGRISASQLSQIRSRANRKLKGSK